MFNATSAPAELGGEISPCLAKSSPYAGPSAGAEVARLRKWHVWCLLAFWCRDREPEGRALGRPLPSHSQASRRCQDQLLFTEGPQIPQQFAIVCLHSCILPQLPYMLPHFVIRAELFHGYVCIHVYVCIHIYIYIYIYASYKHITYTHITHIVT